MQVLAGAALRCKCVACFGLAAEAQGSSEWQWETVVMCWCRNRTLNGPLHVPQQPPLPWKMTRGYSHWPNEETLIHLFMFWHRTVEACLTTHLIVIETFLPTCVSRLLFFIHQNGSFFWRSTSSRQGSMLDPRILYFRENDSMILKGKTPLPIFCFAWCKFWPL